MAYYLYIIQSQIDKSFYIGTTQCLEARLLRHNQGRSRYTRAKKPWCLVYFEKHPDRSSAMKKEYALKRQKRTEFIEALIKDFTL
jgi:putative endonuclease